ncbi:MAG: aldehyde dehydrogenase [Acholeplasmataceae bacterium]|nr:aldehyde dehydrogenase [Acholeplasmataceae bacterium]
MFSELLNLQREFFLSGKTKSYAFRMKQLTLLCETINRYENEIIEALYQDLGKSSFEAYLTEIGVVKKEIKDIKKYLKRYMKPQRVQHGIALFKAKSMLFQEPYGTVLIIAPWNYPFQLAIAPLIGAIAAGNTAVIKVSEYAMHTEKILVKMIEETFSEEYIKVITGGVNESQELLSEHFDYIFFTGSPAVGKIVMKNASEHLTPVTLELGGKSPAIIEDVKDIALISKRIAYGKFINAGQTCIAPDYIWVKEELKDSLIQGLKEAITLFFGNDPINHEDYPKIINQKHHDRLIHLIEDKKVVFGGNYNEIKISPTICDNVSWDDKMMQEEIFGPILPIMSYKKLDEVIKTLKKKDKPLALYLFTEKKNIKKKIVQELSFGGATINDTLMHFANENLPFGGVGNSGMGAYHGKHSFYTFSHAKGVVDRSTNIDVTLRYMPTSDTNIKIIKKLMK